MRIRRSYSADGKLREWTDFKKEALKLDKQYNTVWLRTEYNAAVASSQMAAKWVDFQENADETYLRFDTAGDRRVRPAHALLDGITRPADDKFWDEGYFPPLSFNCRCTVSEILRTKATPTNMEGRKLPPVDDGFKSNVGKSGQVFDKSHPYFQGVPKDDQAILNDIVAEATKKAAQ